jgi:hypothetical protein
LIKQAKREWEEKALMEGWTSAEEYHHIIPEL